MYRRLGLCVLALTLSAAGTCMVGCAGNVNVYPPQAQPIVDRRFVEYPTGLELSVVADNFTAATAVATAPDGHVFVADRGGRGQEVRITRINPATGERREIYPAYEAPLTAYFDNRLKLFGPVGGMTIQNGELFVTGRDERDNGLVVALDLNQLGEEGRPPLRTVVGELPAKGDHGVTAIVAHPNSGRLYFGVGSATNSGVVGVDNWQVGWLQEHPGFHDQPLTALKIFGYRFDTEDPSAGLLNPDKVNTAPFNPFGRSQQRIPAAENSKPTAAVYSIHPMGGDLRVEAHGLRHPRGLAFNNYANLYATNQGMELRGTRPVKDDPDVVVRIPLAPGFGPLALSATATWFGWPDYSADLVEITATRFQPPASLLGRTGYTELSPLIDLEESGALDVADRGTQLAAVFPSLSGAAGLSFVPDDAAGFEPYAGLLVVALNGDRAPFATSGLPLKQPVGYKVVVVDPDRRIVQDLIYNVISDAEPAEVMLDRPVDVTFGPDGALYVLDMGEMRLREGRERFRSGTGKLYRLAPSGEAPGTTTAENDAE